MLPHRSIENIRLFQMVFWNLRYKKNWLTESNNDKSQIESCSDSFFYIFCKNHKNWSSWLKKFSLDRNISKIFLSSHRLHFTASIQKDRITFLKLKEFKHFSRWYESRTVESKCLDHHKKSRFDWGRWNEMNNKDKKF